MTTMLSRLLSVALLSLALAGCGDPAAQTPPPAPPPPEVEALAARATRLPVTHELVGRLSSTRVAEVRARVSGIVLRRAYTEGTDVAEGQVLFRIDPAPLEAALKAAEASRMRAEADAHNAQLIAQRYTELAARRLIARQDLDTALAAQRTTAASVREAEAAERQARLSLGYATVTAPIAGRAGRALVTEGALVGEDQPTPLTTVEQIDPIYVSFGPTVAEYQRVRDAVAPGDDPPPVTVLMPDGTPYPESGRLDFSDVNVDPTTGTVQLRATVPNAGHRLLPGMYVTVRYSVGMLRDAFVLPQAAVLRDGGGAYVLVAGQDGKVARRGVTTHEMGGDSWVVTGEIRDGDQVIIKGVQKARPGAEVKVVRVDAPPPAA